MWCRRLNATLPARPGCSASAARDTSSFASDAECPHSSLDAGCLRVQTTRRSSQLRKCSTISAAAGASLFCASQSSSAPCFSCARTQCPLSLTSSNTFQSHTRGSTCNSDEDCVGLESLSGYRAQPSTVLELGTSFPSPPKWMLSIIPLSRGLVLQYV